ncbi:MAG: stalk domain-containing protein, partial [Caldisericum sp.]|uniref:stalk domain-containing protein n=3 Tax=Caldisericum sp. TaxID=2499687 RepID=UPI003D0E9038
GGTITPSSTITVNYGDSKTFNITPNPGYKIKDVLVDGKSVGAVSSYTFSNITSNHTIEATFEKQITQTIITLQIGNTSFTVNGEQRYLDSPPVIKNGRTLLPIRAIIEALGGTVKWIADTKTVVIELGNNSIMLQIGNANALVNGNNKLIDPQNLKVVPEIINGRTMLPLRFVAESLGADVQWDGTTRTITITYQGG